MSEQPSAEEGSTPPARKRATIRRRVSAGRKASTGGTAARATTRRASATGARPASTTRKRTSVKSTATASATGKRRGRPPGSRNKRTTAAASSSPADSMSKRISDLISENKSLKARVSELEAGWKKIEKALGSEVTRARRTVKRTARAATRKVEQAIDKL